MWVHIYIYMHSWSQGLPSAICLNLKEGQCNTCNMAKPQGRFVQFTLKKMPQNMPWFPPQFVIGKVFSSPSPLPPPYEGKIPGYTTATAKISQP